MSTSIPNDFFKIRLKELQSKLDELTEVIFFLKKNTHNYSKIKKLEGEKKNLIDLIDINKRLNLPSLK